MKIDFAVSSLQKIVLQNKSKITVLSCGRGSGKTATVSLIAITAMLRGERVIICAPTYRTLRDSNFREVVKFSEKMNLNITVNFSELKIKKGKGEIIFLSGENPERFRGYTSITAIIYDEAALLNEDCYKLGIATQRALEGKEKRIYVVSTPPLNPEHWMVKLANREDVSLFFGTPKDNPFIEIDFLESLENEYEYLPEDFKRRELYGEFIFPDEAGALFNEFEISTEDYEEDKNAPIVAGLDIAGMGRDFTFMFILKSQKIIGIEFQKTRNETELKSFVKIQYEKYKFDVLRYDSTGIGHLLEFNFLEKNVEVQPVNFGASGGDRFAKARGAIYFVLSTKKKLFWNEELESKHGRLLRGELKATNYKFDDSLKINLIPKDIIKEKLGRSPDRADALALASSYVVLPKIKPIVMQPIFRKW